MITKRQRIPLVTAVGPIIMLMVFAGLVGGIAAQGAAADEPWVESGWSGGELPNLSIVLRSVSSADPSIEGSILPSVVAIDGVESAFVDVLSGGPPVIHVVASDPDRLDQIASRVGELTSSGDIDGTLLVGGQLISDREVGRAITRSALVAFIPVVLFVGLLVGALHGSFIGVATTLTLAFSSLLGGLIGSSTAGSFDGTLSNTVIPGALSGLLVGATFTFRLISWFKHPASDEAADNMIRSVRAQLPDLALVLGSILVVALVAGLFLEGAQAATAVFMGALFGALATLAVMAPLLSTRDSVPDNTEFRAVPIKIVDGRDLPIIVIGVVALLLLGLGAVAAGSTYSRDLIDASSVDDSDANLVSAELVRLGGDPAAAIRANFPAATGDQRLAWAEAASRYDGVAWVATSAGRFENGELVSAPLDPAPLDDRTAIVNPVESARSETTQSTVRALLELDAPAELELEGLPVDAAATTLNGTASLWILTGLLAALAGLTVYYLVRDVGLAVVAVALRLVSLAAALGSYSLVVAGATSAELQVVLLVLSIGISLFEIGVIRMILDAEESLPNFVSTAMRSGGGHAVAALGVLVLAGVGLFTSGVSVLAAFGLALAVAFLLEMALGIWILGPVILGDQTMRVAGPGVRGRSIIGRRGPSEGEPVNPEWRRVVSGLLREEFRFQTEPGDADLGTVFVEGTPLFSELSQHNLRLRENGLKIRGEGPMVVSVKAVNDGDPVTVAITVDHPSRQLLSADGRLLGIRAAERRDGMLWLAQDPSGRYRISEAVDMGTGVPIPDTPKTVEPASATN